MSYSRVELVEAAERFKRWHEETLAQLSESRAEVARLRVALEMCRTDCQCGDGLCAACVSAKEALSTSSGKEALEAARMAHEVLARNVNTSRLCPGCSSSRSGAFEFHKHDANCSYGNALATLEAAFPGIGGGR